VFADVHLDVVVGAANPHRAALQDLAAHRPKITVHTGIPSLRDLTAAADLAVGGGGVTMLERCCMGLPAIVMTIADNQAPGTRALAAQGCIVHLGDAGSAMNHLAAAAAELSADKARRDALSACGRLLVDGWGAARIAEQIVPTPASALALRPADDGDSRFYYTLVNDPEVRRNSFQSAPIPWEDHQKWFAGKRAARNSRLWVLTAGGLAVGQLRLDRTDRRAYIDYALDSLVRGRGWGHDIIALGLRAFFADPDFVNDDITVGAEVKSSNRASCAIFEKLGFRIVPTGQDDMIAFEMNRTMFNAGTEA
jgi:UDP-2,4-diacetamido-2,4,6-trideoxy-beta-L-altropyranose hydrolase